MSPDTLAPANEAELVEIIAAHHQSRSPLRIHGGGTRMPVPLPGSALATTRLSGIVDYEPGAMTLIARSGTSLSEIEALVASEKQSLAFEPPDLRTALGTQGTSTLGGVIATNASGPRRLTVGACRDHVLGIRFVDGQGRIVKNGGRVMKNVTGLDLGKLFAGSHGTLGVLTEVALKTLPEATARLTLVLPGIAINDAVDLFSRVLATPFEITGAVWADRTVWLRIEGLEAQVDYRRKRLIDLLRPRVVDTLDEDETRAQWRDFRDLRHLPQDGPLWRILIRPTESPAVAEKLERHGGKVALDWGGGLLWYAGPAPAEIARSLGGHALLLRPAGLGASAFSCGTGPAQSLADRVRASFDPAGILNRGLMES